MDVAKEHLYDWYEWLMDTAGVILVWNRQVHYHNVTAEQIESLKLLKAAGLYFGPMIEIIQEQNI